MKRVIVPVIIVIFILAISATVLLIVKPWEGNEDPQDDNPQVENPPQKNLEADISWYRPEEKEMTISSAQALLGLSQLSNAGETFLGKTILLGSDIVLNQGAAANWAKKAPGVIWTPIRGFAGTLDGQGHTVSGLYAKGTEAALMTNTSVNATVTGINLVNSYFSASDSAAGFCTNGAGTYEYLSCNAAVVSNSGNAGGILGIAKGDTRIAYCQFYGSVSVKTQFAGGLVGNGNANNISVLYSLNSGSISSKYDGVGGSQIGGIVGKNEGITLISDCLNTGTISSIKYITDGTDTIGGVFGACMGTQTSNVTIQRSYSVEEGVRGGLAVGQVKGSNSLDCSVIKISSLLGVNARENTELDFFETWVCIDGALPALRCFSDESSLLPYRSDWPMTNLYWQKIPAFMGGTLADNYTVGDNAYDLECHALRFENTGLGNYYEFISNLRRLGFTLHASNGTNGFDGACYQATLYDSNFTVNITYFAQTNETYITSEEYRAVSPLQLASPVPAESGKTKLHMPQLITFGGSTIFQLSNGHFVIIDGAQEHNSQYTIEYLEGLVPAGQTPIVDAWFFTHAHPDHIYCCWGIGADQDLVGRIKVEGFYFTWPNDEGARREKDYSGIQKQIGNLNSVLPNFRTSGGTVTPVYKIHAGMRFCMGELEVQTLLTQDQVMPALYQNGFNDSSTSFKFIVHTKDQTNPSFLIMGDAHIPVCDKLMATYLQSTLHPTYFQSLHHGNNDYQPFFEFIAPDYVIYTATSSNPKNKPGYAWMNNQAKAVYFAPAIIVIS